jgi:hypothetical protein
MGAAVQYRTTTMVDTSTLLTTILTAVKIFEHIPAAGKAMGYLRDTIKNLGQKKTPEIADDSILGKMIKSEEERLKELVEEYDRLRNRPEFDDLTKDRERKRIAAQICKLLALIEEVMRKYIEHFEELKKLFCGMAAKI